MTSQAAAESRPRFELGDHLVAGEPAEMRGFGRDDVRLLVAGPEGIAHRRFADLPDILVAGDVLVVNVSATVPAALDAADGLRLHVSTRLPADEWAVEVRRADGPASRPLGQRPPGMLPLAAGGRVEMLAPYPDAAAGQRLWRARIEVGEPLLDHLRRHGEPIRYPYLRRPWPLERFQTIFAEVPGSSEMPSAARPFTHRLVTRLIRRGIAIVPIVLHTGVSSLESHEAPYPEWFMIPEATARVVTSARVAGQRIIAAGTTVVRALETADRGDVVAPRSGWTDLVVTAGRGVRVVDGLITGWHDPSSTHLDMLVAVGGDALVAESYEEAITAGYLWHEFGDSHLLLRPDAPNG